jgi:multiple sugar transport system substrate-binding protein
MRRILACLITAVFLLPGVVDSSEPEAEITFWTTEVEKDRLKIQNNLAKDFEKKSAIRVRVVPIDENMLSERVTAAYAAKSLPDVLFHPIDFTIGWADAGILDSKRAGEVIHELGPNTFGAGPLNLVRSQSGFAAVPADGWGQILLYRKDLFEAEKLPPPDTWDRIRKAARALHNPPLIWGFEAATDPGQTYTQQVFEHIALSNGVQLTDASGAVRLNTPAMLQTLQFYKDLNRYTPPGNLYWLHTRMDYLTGRAAMIIWSPFILDELAGLRQDQPVLPDMAKGEKGYLARNTGLVTIIQGPGGAAQYGQINYFGITRDADPPSAKAWVVYLLTEGYLKWLSMAPEGKLPVRKGTADDSERFIKGWMDLEFGVTTRAKISKFYGMDTAKSLIDGVDGFDRWGFAGGKGALVSKIYGTKIIPEIVKKFLDGEMDAGRAADMMEARVKALE